MKIVYNSKLYLFMAVLSISACDTKTQYYTMEDGKVIMDSQTPITQTGPLCSTLLINNRMQLEEIQYTERWTGVSYINRSYKFYDAEMRNIKFLNTLFNGYVNNQKNVLLNESGSVSDSVSYGSSFEVNVRFSWDQNFATYPDARFWSSIDFEIYNAVVENTKSGYDFGQRKFRHQLEDTAPQGRCGYLYIYSYQNGGNSNTPLYPNGRAAVADSSKVVNPVTPLQTKSLKLSVLELPVFSEIKTENPNASDQQLKQKFEERLKDYSRVAKQISNANLSSVLKAASVSNAWRVATSNQPVRQKSLGLWVEEQFRQAGVPISANTIDKLSKYVLEVQESSK